MSLEVAQFPCLEDNYGFIARDGFSGVVAAIDPPDGEAVLHALADRGWGLDMVVNTHWHRDHTGGNALLAERTGARIFGPAEVRRAAPLDIEVTDGEEIAIGASRLMVIATPGHTLGHVSYHCALDGVLFVGDTLFALGCGRLFEGTAAQMWASLSRLAALPEHTQVYCAHEYTAANARFAMSIDAGRHLRERAEAVFAAREKGLATVPTTIALERATNPFLRAAQLYPELDPAAAFAAVRSAKDVFKG